jgi:UDPglucose--hexose-1-phosphate uridylyltransferase
MSELRKDIVTGRWVIIATERSKRPDDFRPAAAPAPPAEASAFCPFCEGNESKTPPEVFALRRRGSKPDGPGWRVRVVPNKFPALSPGAPPPRPEGGLFQSMPGVGVHEVVIENPDHGKELADLDNDRVRDVLEVFRERIAAIEENLHYQYVQVFKNKGKEAGASLSHPHSQIVATPIVPKRVKEEVYGAERLFRANRECVFCRTIAEETRRGERLVLRNEHFAALAPFASRSPFEMSVYPLRHTPFFTGMTHDELGSLAAVLRTVLGRLKTTLADPPYNLFLHQAPNPTVSTKAWPGLTGYFHWHIEIAPVLTKVAGFEWGTGFYINPVTPETAAGYLRQAP